MTHGHMRWLSLSYTLNPCALALCVLQKHFPCIGFGFEVLLLELYGKAKFLCAFLLSVSPLFMPRLLFFFASCYGPSSLHVPKMCSLTSISLASRCGHMRWLILSYTLPHALALSVFRKRHFLPCIGFEVQFSRTVERRQCSSASALCV